MAAKKMYAELNCQIREYDVFTSSGWMAATKMVEFPVEITKVLKGHGNTAQISGRTLRLFSVPLFHEPSSP